MELDRLAREAYAAYGDVTGGMSYQGLPVPAWENLGPVIQAAWRQAARAAVRAEAEQRGE